MEEILEKHKALFRSELRQAKTIEAKLHIVSETKPLFCKAQQVPHALQEKVDDELSRLELSGIIEPVQFSEWAAPIVPVLKPNGSVRICGDYKLTVNQAAKLDPYPLPHIEDLFARLAGGKCFTKLDIALAYQQIPLIEESRNSVTINTQKRAVPIQQVTLWCPFYTGYIPENHGGSAQRYSHGNSVHRRQTEEEHLNNLDKVLTHLKEEGLTLKKEKCQFLLRKVEYLGHIISPEGLQPTKTKVRAIKDVAVPQNVSQLRSFLGMVNYYSKFLKDISSKLIPLYRYSTRKPNGPGGRLKQKHSSS